MPATYGLRTRPREYQLASGFTISSPFRNGFFHDTRTNLIVCLRTDTLGGWHMGFPRRQFLQFGAAGVAALAATRMARAVSYPTRPVRVIVPFTAGGATD